TKVDVEWKAAQPLIQSSIDGRPLYRREFQIERDERIGRESVNAVFPDKVTSAALAWRNLAFAAINPWFALFTARWQYSQPGCCPSTASCSRPPSSIFARFRSAGRSARFFACCS